MYRLKGLPHVVNGHLSGHKPLVLQSAVERNASAVKTFATHAALTPASPLVSEEAQMTHFVRQQQLNGAIHSRSLDTPSQLVFSEYQTKRHYSTATAEGKASRGPTAAERAAAKAAANNGVMLERVIPSIQQANESSPIEVNRITVKELRTLQEQKSDFLLVDLREEEARRLEPSIEGSKVLSINKIVKGKEEEPAFEIRKALGLSATIFQSRYGFEKPSTQKKVIFYSNTGKRGDIVTQAAQGLGFDDAHSLVGNHVGGVEGWGETFTLKTPAQKRVLSKLLEAPLTSTTTWTSTSRSNNQGS
ncbi:hypothetical protein PROFUN_13986 [Planoprotostelium fungivorum]|uniref:Rhodanese domain-containing protein n=1 Tax=Planoprotostelium fungivorum TaxID=1890364 RepID=A0A2P6N2L8_9EUKA|nr:hypothetical protein PROFUN_13986 [Planoprotostelium fungivorum]